MRDTLVNERTVSAVNCIARKRPVSSWMAKHRPRSDPRFHHRLILEGEGRVRVFFKEIRIYKSLQLFAFVGHGAYSKNLFSLGAFRGRSEGGSRG